MSTRERCGHLNRGGTPQGYSVEPGFERGSQIMCTRQAACETLGQAFALRLHWHTCILVVLRDKVVGCERGAEKRKGAEIKGFPRLL